MTDEIDRVADIGGTHARFALAAIDGWPRGRSASRSRSRPPTTPASSSPGRTSAGRTGIDLPDELAIAFAGPVGGDVLKLTNNPWMIRPLLMKERLGVDAVHHRQRFRRRRPRRRDAGRRAFPSCLRPRHALPDEGVISIVGPGTGPRRRALLRKARAVTTSSRPRAAISTSPRSTRSKTRFSRNFAARFRRVSVERVASGRDCATSTRHWAQSRSATSLSTMTRTCGRRRSTAATAWRPPRSTGCA